MYRPIGIGVVATGGSVGALVASVPAAAGPAVRLAFEVAVLLQLALITVIVLAVICASGARGVRTARGLRDGGLLSLSGAPGRAGVPAVAHRIGPAEEVGAPSAPLLGGGRQ